jgi:hypothetical protein
MWFMHLPGWRTLGTSPHPTARRAWDAGSASLASIQKQIILQEIFLLRSVWDKIIQPVSNNRAFSPNGSLVL